MRWLHESATLASGLFGEDPPFDLVCGAIELTPHRLEFVKEAQPVLSFESRDPFDGIALLHRASASKQDKWSQAFQAVRNLEDSGRYVIYFNQYRLYFVNV